MTINPAPTWREPDTGPACVRAKLTGLPGPLTILQGKRVRTIKRGGVVTLTERQFLASLIEANGMFRYQCPACNHWYPMLHALGKKRLCPNCVEWRPLKVPLKKHRRPSHAIR